MYLSAYHLTNSFCSGEAAGLSGGQSMRERETLQREQLQLTVQREDTEARARLGLKGAPALA